MTTTPTRVRRTGSRQWKHYGGADQTEIETTCGSIRRFTRGHSDRIAIEGMATGAGTKNDHTTVSSVVVHHGETSLRAALLPVALMHGRPTAFQPGHPLSQGRARRAMPSVCLIARSSSGVFHRLACVSGGCCCASTATAAAAAFSAACRCACSRSRSGLRRTCSSVNLLRADMGGQFRMRTRSPWRSSAKVYLSAVRCDVAEATDIPFFSS